MIDLIARGREMSVWHAMSAVSIQQSTHGDIQSVATGSILADPMAVTQGSLDCGAVSGAEFDGLRVEVPA